MADRLSLHTEFEIILDSKNVYFCPPESVKLKYPCIVYSLSGVNKENANDRMYKSVNEYEVTVIDRDPESVIHHRILAHFPMCRFDRPYVSENLHHSILTLYY